MFAELQRRRLQGRHGQPMDEATSPLANPSSRDAEYNYEAVPVVDFAQAAIDKRMDEYRKQHGDRVPAGLTWQVRKVQPLGR